MNIRNYERDFEVSGRFYLEILAVRRKIVKRVCEQILTEI